MKTAKEVLTEKAIQNNDGFLTGQIKWLVEAMEEYANSKLINLDDCLAEKMYSERPDKQLTKEQCTQKWNATLWHKTILEKLIIVEREP